MSLNHMLILHNEEWGTIERIVPVQVKNGLLTLGSDQELEDHEVIQPEDGPPKPESLYESEMLWTKIIPCYFT